MIQPTMTVTIAQAGMGGIGSAVDRRLARLRPAEREAPGQCGGLELVHGHAGDEPLQVIWAAAALKRYRPISSGWPDACAEYWQRMIMLACAQGCQRRGQ
jgi:hypothetical protein